MATNIQQARQYINLLDLTDTPRGILRQDAATEAGAIFDKAKKQAQVIGSGLFSFTEGVTEEVREAISDSALLAQLVANKKASAQQNPNAWFTAYSEVLQNIGWTVQESGWNDYTAKDTGFEVNEKIADVLAAALGPAGPAALAIINASISALKAMQPNSSWITIFNRESRQAKIGRFQIGLVDKDEKGEVFVLLLGCLLEVENTLTQILFFKFNQADAQFRANIAKVSINRASLTDLAPAIRTKTRAYQADYLGSIVDI